MASASEREDLWPDAPFYKCIYSFNSPSHSQTIERKISPSHSKILLDRNKTLSLWKALPALGVSDREPLDVKGHRPIPLYKIPPEALNSHEPLADVDENLKLEKNLKEGYQKDANKNVFLTNYHVANEEHKESPEMKGYITEKTTRVSVKKSHSTKYVPSDMLTPSGSRLRDSFIEREYARIMRERELMHPVLRSSSGLCIHPPHFGRYGSAKDENLIACTPMNNKRNTKNTTDSKLVKEMHLQKSEKVACQCRRPVHKISDSRFTTCSSLPNISNHISSKMQHKPCNCRHHVHEEVFRSPKSADKKNSNVAPDKKSDKSARKKRKPRSGNVDKKRVDTKKLGNQSNCPCQGELSEKNVRPVIGSCRCDSLPRLRDLQIDPKKNASTVSIGCVTENTSPPIGNLNCDKNITIQIIPNYEHLKPSSGNCRCHQVQRESNLSRTLACSDSFSPGHQTENDVTERRHCEDVVKPSSGILEPYHSTCSRTRAMPVTSSTYKSYREYDMNRKSANKWWNCSWRSRKRKHSSHRNRQHRNDKDCCTTIDPKLEEYLNCQRVKPVSNDYKMISLRDSERGQTIPNAYPSTQENFLKSLQRLNKGLVRDLFATPSPSSYKTCSRYCPGRITELPQCYSLKPATINQCVQYESNSKPDSSLEKLNVPPSVKDTNQTLHNYLKYLLKSVTLEDDDVEFCCCCHNNNNCCCCRRFPRCYPFDAHNKIQEKIQTKSRCRSVEVKQSVRDYGTVVSTHNFKRIQTRSTNTEPCVKTPGSDPHKKHLRCCKPRCCCCSSCCPYKQNFSYCECQHLTYHCQCDPFFLSEKSSVGNRKNPLQVIENSSKSSVKSQRDEWCQFDANKSSVKSTNTVSSRDEILGGKEELVQNFTRNIPTDKTLTKFGAPSQYYPWCASTFLPDITNEMFLGAKSSQKVAAVTSPSRKKRPSSNIVKKKRTPKNSTVANTTDAAGDIIGCDTAENRYLSAICEEIFSNKEREKQNIEKNDWIPRKKCKISSDTKFSSNISIGTSERSKSDTHTWNRTVKIYSEDKTSELRQKFTAKNSRIPIRCEHKKKIEDLNGKDSNKVESCPPCFIYRPKPFTTMTGLMWFPSESTKQHGSRQIDFHNRDDEPSSRCDKLRCPRTPSKVKTRRLESKQEKPFICGTKEETGCDTKHLFNCENYSNMVNRSTDLKNRTQSTDLDILAIKEEDEITDLKCDHEYENSGSTCVENECNTKKIDDNTNICEQSSDFATQVKLDSFPVPLVNTNVSNIVRCLEYRNRSSSPGQLLGSVRTSPEHFKDSSDLNNFQFDENNATNRNTECYPNGPSNCKKFHENPFQRTMMLNFVQVSDQIFSNKDASR